MRIIAFDVESSGLSGEARLILRLVTDDGHVGLAETTRPKRPGALLAILDEFRPLAVGSDPTSPVRVALSLREGEPRAICPTVAIAVGLVETACWDLAAAALRVPLHRLLGGALRDRVRACAARWEPPEDGESLVEAARRVMDLGYRILRFDPFRRQPREVGRGEVTRAIRACEAVRAAVGPEIDLWIDLGGRFSPSGALRLARALERLDPAGLFDPIGPVQSRAGLRVAERMRLPVALSSGVWDASDARATIDRTGIAILQVDPVACGGPSVVRAIASLTESSAVGLALRVGSGSIATAIGYGLAAVLPSVAFLEVAIDPGAGSEVSRPEVVEGWLSLGDGRSLALTPMNPPPVS